MSEKEEGKGRRPRVKLGGMDPNRKFHSASMYFTMEERLLLYKILAELQQEGIKMQTKDVLRILLKHPGFKKFLKEAYKEANKDENSNV